MALVAASLAAKTRSSTTSPRGGPRLLPAGSGGTPTPRQGRRRGRNRDVQLLPPAGVAAVMPCLEGPVGPGVQIRHRKGVGAAGRQPSCPPRQRPPAISIARSFTGRASLHRPLGSP